MNPAQPITSALLSKSENSCFIVSKRPSFALTCEPDGVSHVITRMRDFGYTYIESAVCSIRHGSTQNLVLSVFRKENELFGIMDDIHDLPEDEIDVFPLDEEIC